MITEQEKIIRDLRDRDLREREEGVIKRKKETVISGNVNKVNIKQYMQIEQKTKLNYLDIKIKLKLIKM